MVQLPWLSLSAAGVALAAKTSLPAYPLAVKTPYLSTWLRYNESTSVTSASPIFWNGQELTWPVIARIDNTTYCLFGCPGSSLAAANQTGITYTSTHTYIDVNAGGVDMTLDFFSPVSLTDYTRQSIPYSYLQVKINSGAEGGIDVMTGIDDTWTSQQPNTQSKVFDTDSGSHGFMLSGTNSYLWSENKQMAGWGDVVLAANDQQGGKVSYQVGSADDVINEFSQSGSLNGETDDYSSGGLVAVAYTLDSSSTCATFAVGLEQQNAFNWLGDAQTGYYQATVSGTPNVVDHFFEDISAAWEEGAALDKHVTDIGGSISSNYSEVLESSIRQTWASLQVLIPLDTKDTSKAKAWTKEISTDGNIQTTADLVPKMFPAFYVLAPEYMRLMLEPLMEYSLTWPAQFAFHDLGKSYPNATGETVEAQEALILDQTSVMHWIALAYVKASGNTEWVKPYLPALQKFADYLVDNGLYPAKQQSAVDTIGPTANQTVLAIYSAIGLTAYGALSGQQNYTDIGKSFVPTILELGTDPDMTHITAHYGDNASVWITTYPFAYDKMLGLDTFNQSVYDMQSKWYEGQLSTYGMLFFSGIDYTLADIMAWAAATSSDYVRGSLIDGIHNFLTDGLNSVPGPTRYYVTGNNSGKYHGSIAKGNVASYFMPTAVDLYQDS